MCFVHVYFCQFKFDLFHLSLPPSHPATIHSPYICLHQPLPSSPTTNPSLHVINLHPAWFLKLKLKWMFSKSN
ncbi:hypothetical protein HanRHA438_Chr14g0657481 [Helianthus annuus]|nr:hypothetical protein HanRHA438_Chr14g0657481 [Helianthus annuus]